MSIVHPVIDAVQIFATQDATEAHLKAAHSCKAWRGRAFYGISTAVRARLAAAFGKDRPAAFIEDAVAFLGAVPTLVLVMSPKTVEVTARVHGDKSFAQPPPTITRYDQRLRPVTIPRTRCALVDWAGALSWCRAPHAAW